MCARIGTKIINALLVLLLNVSLGSVLSAQTVDDLPLSPRLAALQDRLKSGDRDALSNFWKEIDERGAPIVEPAAGSDRDVLVTMLWRAKEETRNVFVFRLGTSVSRWYGCSTLTCGTKHSSFRRARASSINLRPTSPTQKSGEASAALRAPSGTTRSIHSSSPSALTSSTHMK